MICPRKVVILTKCYSLQLCASHYRIANSFWKKKLFKQNIKQHPFVIFLQGRGSNLLWMKICGHYEAGIELFVYLQQRSEVSMIQFLIGNFRRSAFYRIISCPALLIDTCVNTLFACVFFNVHVIFCATGSFQCKK